MANASVEKWALVVALCALSLVVGCSEAHPKIQPSVAGDLRIDGVTIVGTEEGSLSPGMSILIKDGRIVRVGRAEDGEPDDPGIRRVDGAARFVVPGYNDMHSHVLGPEDPTGELAFMLANGITGFRQMSGSDELLERRRNGTLPIGQLAPALLVLPGAVLTPFNAGSPDQARDEIRRQAAGGADFIKVAIVSPDVSGVAIEEARRVGLPIAGHIQQGVDPRRAVDDGMRAIEHLGPGDAYWISCSSDEGALRRQSGESPALRAPPFRIPDFVQRIIMGWISTMLINPAAFAEPERVELLQHAFDTYEDAQCRAFAAHLAASGAWQIPTLVRLRTQYLADDPAYGGDPALSHMPEDRIAAWRKVTDRFRALPQRTRDTYRQGYARSLDMTRMLYEAGAPMMVGTDSGEFAVPGQSIHQEFDELASAGLPPLAILQMTTLDPARFLGRTDRMGSVAEGRNGDLVLLDANPVESAQALHRIVGVVRAGVYYSATDLDELRARVRAGRGHLQ